MSKAYLRGKPPYDKPMLPGLGGPQTQHMPARMTRASSHLKNSSKTIEHEPSVPEVIDHHLVDPATMQVENPGDLVLFQPEDVAQGLAIFEATVGTIGRMPDQPPHEATLLAMREVMLHALRIAAINLDVHSDDPLTPVPRDR